MRHFAVAVFGSFLIVACSGATFDSPAGKSKSSTPTVAPAKATTVKVIDCSAPVNVPGTANPYFAGVPNASFKYKDSCTDTAAVDAPPQITFLDPSCLAAGSMLSFDVTGTIDHGGDPSDGNGVATEIPGHDQRFFWGKSNIIAPINSMLGVFLDDSDPSANTNDPGTLDFTAATTRNQLLNTPKLRQIFFIGTGKTADSQLKKFTVPTGATRFFFGVMDSYEWCDNGGVLTGKVTSYTQ